MCTGSIPEYDGGNIYNTCSIFSPRGDIIAKYRKMHLFDIDVPGKIRFQESEVLKAGNDFAVFNVGMSVCSCLPSVRILVNGFSSNSNKMIASTETVHDK